MIGAAMENKLFKNIMPSISQNLPRVVFPTIFITIIIIFLYGCAYITDIQSKILNDPYLKMQTVTTWPFNGDYDWPSYDEITKSAKLFGKETNGYYVVRLECFSQGCHTNVLPEFHPLSDSIIQVSSKKFSGSDAEYGIIIRSSHDDNGDNAYLFSISNELRSYCFMLKNHNDWRTLIDWTESSSIKQNEFNTLMLRSYKDNFELFINGTIQNKIKDSTLSGGYAGLLVSLQNQGDQAEIYFDDFQISE
jgi:hypothetical protein